MTEPVQSHPQQKVLMLTSQPQDMEPFLALMPDVALMPVQDVLHDKAALRERVADSFMASDCDVIIIDSRTPLDLTTLCRTIREYPAGKESHVLVMTHSEQDWAACMSLNVDDVVRVKPNEPVMASLATVMSRYMRALSQRQRLEEKSRQAQVAIETAAEYSALLRFMEMTEKQTELTGLARLVERHLAGKGLDNIVCILAPNEKVVYPPAGAPAGHYAILEKIIGAGTRSVEADRFLGYLAGSIAILISNAPYRDADKYGNLKESLAHIGSIADNCARNIVIKHSVNAQQQSLLDVLQNIRHAADHFHANTHEIMVTLNKELEHAAGTFDMPAEDEAKLLAIAATARDKLDQLLENRDTTESHLNALIDGMNHLKTLIDPPQPSGDQGDAPELF